MAAAAVEVAAVVVVVEVAAVDIAGLASLAVLLVVVVEEVAHAITVVAVDTAAADIAADPAPSSMADLAAAAVASHFLLLPLAYVQAMDLAVEVACALQYYSPQAVQADQEEAEVQAALADTDPRYQQHHNQQHPLH